MGSFPCQKCSTDANDVRFEWKIGCILAFALCVPFGLQHLWGEMHATLEVKVACIRAECILLLLELHYAFAPNA